MADQRHGPVLLSKTDLSDGFYQLHLTPSGALKLAVPFPSAANEPPLIAVPTFQPVFPWVGQSHLLLSLQQRKR